VPPVLSPWFASPA
jgi:hypothetical protein